MILQWILTSSILILAVAILGRALGSRVPARLRYALWLVVLARLLIPVQLFTTPVSFVPQPQVPEAMKQDSIYIIPAGSVPVEKASEVGAYVTEDGQVGMMTSMGYARLEDGGETVVRYLDKVSPIDIFMTIWKMGAVLMLTVVAVSNFRFSRRLKWVRAPLEVMEHKLPVYQAEGLPGPCLFGVLRPAIYVTGEVLSDERALRHVLAHEMTHFRHGDHIWSALRGVALTIHWWNPLVWLAVAMSKQDGELACDEGALQRLGDAERTAYGATLLKLVSAPARRADMLRFTTTMTGGLKEMKRRIERITCKRKHLVILSAAMIVVLSILGACSFAAPKDKDAVSDEARRVIEVMMTAPNDDLIPKLMYGLGMSYTEEEKAAIQAESDRVIQNWEDAIGEYFSEGMVISGINTNTVNAFQTRWEAFGKEYAVVDMVRTFKDEKREEVDVTYTADGEEHHILVRLRINTDGKFYKIEYDLVDSPGTYFNILAAEEPDEVGKETETASESTDPRDFPDGETRLSVMGENDDIWIQMSDETTSQGNNAGNVASVVLTVYTQEGKFIQDISYSARLSKDVHLIDMVRSPADFLTLEDVNGDGADDIRVVTDTLTSGEKRYLIFLWDEAARQFIEDR